MRHTNRHLQIPHVRKVLVHDRSARLEPPVLLCSQPLVKIRLKLIDLLGRSIPRHLEPGALEGGLW